MTDHQQHEKPESDILRMTAEIVAAYVGKNTLATQQIPDVINTVFSSLVGLKTGRARASFGNSRLHHLPGRR